MILALLVAAASPATPHEVAARMFAAFNAHDATAMAELYTRDAMLTSPDFCAPRGRDDIERTYLALFRTYPDIQDIFEQEASSGDIVAIRFTATAKSADFKLPIATFLRIRDGLIVEDRSYFDNGGRPCAR